MKAVYPNLVEGARSDRVQSGFESQGSHYGVLAQSAEASGSNPDQSGFESQGRYYPSVAQWIERRSTEPSRRRFESCRGVQDRWCSGNTLLCRSSITGSIPVRSACYPSLMDWQT